MGGVQVSGRSAGVGRAGAARHGQNVGGDACSEADMTSGCPAL